MTHTPRHDPNANRPGYKPTAVGWIPEEWECVALSRVAEVQTGLAKGKKGLRDPVSRPYLRVANVQDGHVDLSEVKTILVESSEVDRYSLRKGDVLFTEGGDFDKLGRGCVWDGQIPDCLHQNHIFAVRCDSRLLLPTLLAKIAAGPHGRRYFLLSSKQSTNLASINSSQLKAFPIPLPPLPEQEAIAEVLSTWDRTIEQVRRLIAEKQALKKGLMQQLLTGKKRLPGFGVEWEWPKAATIFHRVSERSHGSEPVLSVTQDGGVVIRAELGKRIDFDSANTSNYKVAEPGDFIISLRSFQGGLELCTLRGRVSPAYHVLRASAPICETFYSYFFKSYDFIEHLDIAVIGIRDGKQVSYDDFAFLNIPAPPVREQRAIAQVLSTADSEIKSLEAQSALLEQQKKGLMQALLTGQVRVK